MSGPCLASGTDPGGIARVQRQLATSDAALQNFGANGVARPLRLDSIPRKAALRVSLSISRDLLERKGIVALTV